MSFITLKVPADKKNRRGATVAKAAYLHIHLSSIEAIVPNTHITCTMRIKKKNLASSRLLRPISHQAYLTPPFQPATEASQTLRVR